MKAKRFYYYTSWKERRNEGERRKERREGGS